MTGRALPTAREIVALAFDATGQAEFRREVLERLARATGSELGVYCNALEPLDPNLVINMKVEDVDDARQTVIERPDELARTNQALIASGVVIDTEIHSQSEWERLPNIELHQRAWGVTSNLYLFWFDQQGDPILLNLSKVGGYYTAEQRQQTQRLLQALVLADSWPRKTSAPPSAATPEARDLFSGFSAVDKPLEPGRIGTETRAELSGLTERQREIVEYLAIGYSNAEIARACGISIYTVRNHLVRLFERYMVATRTELVSRLYLERRSG
jgi:DNA-binding CsgD family transcriptional regulator